MTREGRQVGILAAQSLIGANGSTDAILPEPFGGRIVSARAVATVRLERFSSPHDLGRELWYRCEMLRPGTVVRLEVGRVWPPRYIADLRADLSYAVDTDRADVADAWIEALQRAAAMAALA